MRDAVLRKLDRPLPPWVRPVFGAAAAAGALAFLFMALGAGSGRAWRAYHVNWLFWTGLAQGGVMFSVVTNTAKGKWSYPIRRIAEASVAFLPVSFALFLVLWLGRAEVFPWIRHPIEEPHVKAFWLRDGFLFGRDILALLVLYGLSFWFVFHSLRPDAALLQAGASDRVKGLYSWLARGFDRPGRGEALSQERRDYIGPGLIVAYAVCMSVLAFDLIMSLAPHWLSNLLGGFFFMGAWLTGLMSLALLAIFWRRHLQLEELISPRTLHDLGKLCFGFTVFWCYLFFSQFLVIWYGNMPEETSFMFLRMASPEWRNISTAMLVLVFFLPFWGLIGVKPKKTPAVLGTFAAISLAGVWVDRYVLTVPSIVQQAPALPLGWQEAVVTAGFMGLWGLSYAWFAERFPIVSPTLIDKYEEYVAGAH
jgi:hypothetical protein